MRNYPIESMIVYVLSGALGLYILSKRREVFYSGKSPEFWIVALICGVFIGPMYLIAAIFTIYFDIYVNPYI